MEKNKDEKPNNIVDLDKIHTPQLPNHFTQQVAQMAEAARKMAQIYVPTINIGLQNIIAENKRVMDSLLATQKSVTESISKIIDSGFFDQIQKTAEIVAKLARNIQSHFPKNWPTGKIRECVELCTQGVPIILVPRREVVLKFLRSKSIAGVKRAAIRNDAAIIEDCREAIAEAEAEWLSRDMKLQIVESIDCYESGKYRAAQSTATVAFDSLLNEIVDIRSWRRTNGNRGKLSAQKVKQLADEFAVDLMELPLNRAPFYTLLMFPVIGNALTDFAIGDRASYTNHYNRHVSAHTVSSKQYKRSNALFAIMTVASICKITQLRGKNWMQVSAKEYGVTMR